MRVLKQNTARFPTLLEAMGKGINTPENGNEDVFGAFENNPVILAQKYSHIIQNLILFEKETQNANTVDEVIEKFKNSLRRIVPYKSADIFFFTETKGELESIGSFFDNELLDVVNHYYKEGILSIVFERKLPVFVPDLETYTEEASDFNYLFFPII